MRANGSGDAVIVTAVCGEGESSVRSRDAQEQRRQAMLQARVLRGVGPLTYITHAELDTQMQQVEKWKCDKDARWGKRIRETG